MLKHEKLRVWLDSPWYGLWLIGLFLIFEGVGLFTQHVLGLAPCDNCVITRAWISLIFLGALIALLKSAIPSHWTYRREALTLLSYIVTNIGVVMAFVFSLFNHEIEMGVRFASCSLKSPFPEWLPLDTIAPAIFKPEGLCGTPIHITEWLTFTELTMFAMASTWAGLLVLHHLAYVKK